ncbi:S-adenosyl-L-methionine-dependent methyltransferase [Heliocybe sulcata]|uniref:S-adenosyl-L-methionine-dependent methyltransferase n=1 Tax=Heliocybe sulcata TaxID=5364 RepID=A0A5C3N8I7_9AGAM|nr:S-adenosyl-L-methionine-dependent methyltransferase [Heliocybe sulcata]
MLCIYAHRVLYYKFLPQLKFIWHCFLRPIGTADQRSRLDQFYEGQAEVYDATRNGLLRGRETMLELSAAHLRLLRENSPNKRLVWVDIGGGTGYNIEAMDQFFPISSFDAVYLVDLCEPLLEVARKRFKQRGWSNVTVMCQDASEFHLPEWDYGVEPKGSVGFVTLSYSLSMIPSFYTLLDRIDHVLAPEEGLIGVVDFYTSGRQASLHEKAIGGDSKECGWLSRWFWQIWFDFDHVSLSPHRRDYLEYKFGTVKSYNGRNRFVLPFIVRIPYYIWLGRSRSCDVSAFCHAFEVEGGNTIGNCSPSPRSLQAGNVVKESELIPSLEIGEPAIPLSTPESEQHRLETAVNITPPLSSFHYQIKMPWRLPYYESPVHKEFRTFMYSFTWEDPVEDMKYLKLGRDDSMLVITSAGDNALHYAINARPKRIHCVDMNPCQGHLLELKLAALHSLNYDDFFRLFGLGKHPKFSSLLSSTISPYLSSNAYQFWRLNEDAFSSSFYIHGYSGIALRFARFLFRLTGLTDDVERLCRARTLYEQDKIWREKIRPVLLNPVVVALLKNPVFCWNALGVPMNQRRLLLEDGTAYDFVRDTFDSITSTYSLRDGAYFYLLCLLGRYTPESCPDYLTQAGFETLKANQNGSLDAFRLHTESIANVLRGLSPASLTRALIMDHLDWFAPGAKEVDEEVKELHRAMAPGGIVLWRSAGKKPWYREVFKKNGFTVTVISTRSSKASIDRVNMYVFHPIFFSGIRRDTIHRYASFWRAIRM